MSSLEANVRILDDYSKILKDQICKSPSGLIQYPYITAGSKVFEYMVDWDAIWGGMAMLIDGDSDPLRYSLLNLLEHIAPDGKGQRVLKPNGYGAPVFHNRPFLATGAFVLTRELGSSDWLSSDLWNNLRNYLFYYHNQRMGRSGLVKWLKVDEGFADNGLGNWAWDANSVEAVDLNAQLVLEHTAAAYIADRMGRENEAREHRRYARNLNHRIQSMLWDEQHGCYFSLYNPPERRDLPYPIKVQQYTNLWPLWLGLAPQDRAKRIIEGYVLNEEHYWSEHGIRSMAKSVPQYNNAVHGITLPMRLEGATGPGIHVHCSNWQGPIWTIPNYTVALALKRYGYGKEALQLTETFVKVLADGVTDKGCFYENYCAETGVGLANGGIASWNLMVRFLPEQLDEETPWILKDLDLPASES